MWTIKYVNKTSGAVIVECCLWRYCEKRRLFLSEQEDIEILEVRSWKGIAAFFLCLFRKSAVIDYLPVEPKGEYRIGKKLKKGVDKSSAPWYNNGVKGQEPKRKEGKEQ